MKWDYKIIISEPLHSSPTKGPNINKIIDNPKFFSGTNEPIWDKVLELGNDGWELINVIPNLWDGSTHNLVFFFKKLIE